MAGAISSQSCANIACGLMPATAMRGRGRPHLVRLSWTSRMTCSTRSGVTKAIASVSGTCSLIGTTRRAPVMRSRKVPAGCSSSTSVIRPVSLSEALSTGPMTRAWMLPLAPSSLATRIHSSVAWPDAADASPNRHSPTANPPGSSTWTIEDPVTLSWSEAICRTGHVTPLTLAARRTTPTSPISSGSHNPTRAPLAMALTHTSGPTPAGSPTTTAIRGRSLMRF